MWKKIKLHYDLDDLIKNATGKALNVLYTLSFYKNIKENIGWRKLWADMRELSEINRIIDGLIIKIINEYK